MPRYNWNIVESGVKHTKERVDSVLLQVHIQSVNKIIGLHNIKSIRTGNIVICTSSEPILKLNIVYKYLLFKYKIPW